MPLRPRWVIVLISIATDQYNIHRGHWDSADVMGTLYFEGFLKNKFK